MKLEHFNNLVDSFSSLPTVGKKSALRFAYHLVLKDSFLALKLANSIENAIKHVKKCSVCNGVSEDEICDICSDESRDKHCLCIVLHPKDIVTLEENANYNGRYFVVDNLNDDAMEQLTKVVTNGIEEVVFAFPPSLANESLIILIEDKLKNFKLKFTKIAQGVPTGVDLENVDMISLSKAIEQRTNI